MKNLKRLTAVLLVLMLLMSACAFQAAAEASGPELKALSVNGVKIDLKPGVFEYDFVLSSRHRSSSLPRFEYETKNSTDFVTKENPAGIPGTVRLYVESADGLSGVYSVNLSKSEEPEGISRTTSWIGNTYPGTGSVGDEWYGEQEGWVQNFILGFYVAPDGSCYTTSHWDEGGKKHGVYKDGYAMGNATVREEIVQPIVNGEEYQENGQNVTYVERTLELDEQRIELDPLVAKLSTSTSGSADSETVEKATVWTIEGKDVVKYDRSVKRTKGTVLQNGEEKNGTRKEITENRELGRISGLNNPTAVAISNYDGTLMVADSTDGKIYFYDISGANQNNPQRLDDRTFGSGNIGSGEPGVMEPTKLWDIIGLGTDEKGNLYVAQSNKYAIMKSFSPSGELLWELDSFAFVDTFDFDPTTDGKDIYGMTTHYEATGSEVPGEDYRLVSYTMDLEKYPNDPRALFKTTSGHPVTSVTIRYINGQKFMFITGMHYSRMFIYRFDGEIAVPAGVVTDGRMELSYYEQEWKYLNDPNPIPNQPDEDVSYIWRDKNGDGQFDEGEFETLAGKMSTSSGSTFFVDDNGDIWIVLKNAKGALGDGLLRLTCKALDSHGNPVYSFAASTIYDLPEQFNEIRRLHYDASKDVLYLSGYTDEYVYDGNMWNSAGRVIYRYDNWSTNNQNGNHNIHAGYPIILSYYGGSDSTKHMSPMGFDVAGDRLFLPYGALGPLGYPTGEMHVFDTETGKDIGCITPGEVVGGFSAVGWVDIPEPVRAMQLSDGTYKVLLEEDYKGKNLLYTVTPYNGIPEMDGELGGRELAVKAQKIGDNVTVLEDGQLDGGLWNYEQELTVLVSGAAPSYLQGYDDGQLHLEYNISREEVSAILCRVFTEKLSAYGSQKAAFPDVASDRWSSESIGTMQQAGTIQGYSDGTFRPEGKVTRAEFVTMLARFFNLSGKTETKLGDISGHWAEDYILAAVKEGWINGYPDGTFRPDQPITRGEVVIIIGRITGDTGSTTVESGIMFDSVWDADNLYLSVNANTSGTITATFGDKAYTIANGQVSVSGGDTAASVKVQNQDESGVTTLTIPMSELGFAKDRDGNDSIRFNLKFQSSTGTYQFTSDSDQVTLIKADDLYLVPYTLSAVNLDGILDEEGWNLSKKPELSVGEFPSDADIRFGLMWDESNLYVGIRVKDKTPNQYTGTDTSYYRGDSLEVYVDANNDKGGPYDDHDNQYVIPYNIADALGARVAGRKEGVKLANVTTAEGFDAELVIPWRTLNIPSVSEGRSIGFDVAYNDNQNGNDTRSAVLVWAGDLTNFQNNMNFGDAKLLPADTSAVSEAPTAPTDLKVVSAGQDSITLSWNASTDAYGVKGYTVESSDGKTRTVTDTGISIGGLAPNTEYTFTVKAFNGGKLYSEGIAVTGSTTQPMTAVKLEITQDMVTASHASFDGKADAATNGWRVFDGDYKTFCDTADEWGSVIVDLGAGNEAAVGKVKYAPRGSHASRMVGGQFQASDDGENWTTIYTVPGTPEVDQMTEANTNNTRAYRYYRYYSTQWTNVSEIEFYVWK